MRQGLGRKRQGLQRKKQTRYKPNTIECVARLNNDLVWVFLHLRRRRDWIRIFIIFCSWSCVLASVNLHPVAIELIQSDCVDGMSAALGICII
ncbi:hypothetical protein BDQ12DRAFT_500187 [Crucibulum laeve]|uniref:Uncharacterized protein n=1 Tax=Crucibulum laeve TaxID=68775 RepID=A0A5C3LIU4_9AGAR|nr:hypothetical protein BDQ12DRAFT_500187 [Crucibulum laeve]